MRYFFRAVGSMLVASALVACGGGGGGDSLYDPDDGDDGGSEVVANNIDLTVNKFTLSNSGSDAIIVTATALDGSNSVAGVPIAIESTSGVLTKTGSETDQSGNLSATLAVGSDPSNRSITITAKLADGTSKTEIVEVVGSSVTATLVPSLIAPRGAGKIEYRLVNQSGAALPRQAYSVSAPGFSPSSAQGSTGTSGDFVFAYSEAPASPGDHIVTVSISGVVDERAVQIQSANTVVPAVTETIRAASISASPSVISVNSGSSVSSRSEIRALFLTADNQPLKNVRVRFDLAGDPNSVGGVLSTGSSTTLTDANGVATSAYIAGNRSSPTDGVTVRACYSGTDFTAQSCPMFAAVKLTVSSEPLGVSIGTNAEILDNDLTFIKQFVVSVVDSSGAAKAGVNLTGSIELLGFRKGFYTVRNAKWTQFDLGFCRNEDQNLNGVLENGEDSDRDGRLEPGVADVSVRLLQAQTRADGTAVLQIQYAKSFASWVDIKINVAASGVSGSEGRTSVTLIAPTSTEEINNVEVPPSFEISPYGKLAGCTNAG